MQGQLATDSLEFRALNGDHISSPLGTIAPKVLLGTRLNEAAAAAAQAAALGAENTDGQMQIPLFSGIADGGTYTKAITSAGVRTVTRAAADPADSFWVEIPVRARTSTGKGIKATGVKLVYSVNTADAQDIRAELYKRVIPADNAAPAAPTLLGGDQNAHYDDAHNTAAERGDDTGAPENHTLTMTLPAPAYLADGEQLLLRIFCDGAATSVIVITDAILLYSETLADLA